MVAAVESLGGAGEHLRDRANLEDGIPIGRARIAFTHSARTTPPLRRRVRSRRRPCRCPFPGRRRVGGVSLEPRHRTGRHVHSSCWAPVRRAARSTCSTRPSCKAGSSNLSAPRLHPRVRDRPERCRLLQLDALDRSADIKVSEGGVSRAGIEPARWGQHKYAYASRSACGSVKRKNRRAHAPVLSNQRHL